MKMHKTLVACGLAWSFPFTSCLAQVASPAVASPPIRHHLVHHHGRHHAATDAHAGHLRRAHAHLAASLPAPSHAVAATAAVAMAAKPVVAAAADSSKGSDSGLPLPRYAALRSDEVSFRSGPGTRYPIEWIYQRRYLPVEIEREFEVWRLVAEPDGTKGWVHEAMLTGRRSFLITGAAPQTLRAQDNDAAPAVAILKPGVVGLLRRCPSSGWCEVEVGGYSGWLPRSGFWGTLPDETLTP